MAKWCSLIILIVRAGPSHGISSSGRSGGALPTRCNGRRNQIGNTARVRHVVGAIRYRGVTIQNSQADQSSSIGSVAMRRVTTHAYCAADRGASHAIPTSST